MHIILGSNNIPKRVAIVEVFGRVYTDAKTDDLITRQQAYEQGILFALAQFKHPELL